MNKKIPFSQKLNNFAIIVLKVIGIALFTFMTWQALRYSVLITPGQDEIPVTISDQIIFNIIAIVVALSLFFLISFLGKSASLKLKRIILAALLTCTTVFVIVAGFLWVNAYDRIPSYDQLMVYDGAKAFLAGDYSFLNKGNYFSEHPYQLGLVLIMEIIFKLTGTTYYLVFEYMNVLYAGGIVLLGYFIVKLLCDSFAAKITYCIAMLFCTPLIAYTSWVYGEMPGVFFSLLAGFLFILYFKKRKTLWLVGILLFTIVACLYRNVSAMIAIGMFVIAVFDFFWHKDRKLLVFSLVTVLMSFLIYKPVYAYYGQISGIKVEAELPRISWIAMGQEDEAGRGPGWYNDFPTMYHEMGWTEEELNDYMKENLSTRLDYIKSHPAYAVDFYKRKTVSQWNEPLYESVFFSAMSYAYSENDDVNPTLKAYTIGEKYSAVFNANNILQLIVYLGAFLYCIFAVKRNEPLGKHVLLVTVLGGFVFSLIWESKGRYIFPYYMMLFPLAVTGFEAFIGDGN